MCRNTTNSSLSHPKDIGHRDRSPWSVTEIGHWGWSQRFVTKVDYFLVTVQDFFLSFLKLILCYDMHWASVLGGCYVSGRSSGRNSTADNWLGRSMCPASSSLGESGQARHRIGHDLNTGSQSALGSVQYQDTLIHCLDCIFAEVSDKVLRKCFERKCISPLIWVRTFEMTDIRTTAPLQLWLDIWMEFFSFRQHSTFVPV